MTGAGSSWPRRSSAASSVTRRRSKYFGKYQKEADPAAFDRLTAVVRAIEARRRDVDGVIGERIDDARAGLLAVEGGAGRQYWTGVRTLLEGHASFETREHRGAPDTVNSALNYGYGILYTQVWGAIMNAGLEPFAGFLHVDRPGKPSLVLDLIEEFRQPIVDRAVIAALTKGPVDFKDTAGGPRRNHRFQLAAYALLAEDTFHRPAADGFIYLVPEKRIVALGLTEADRNDVRQALADIRRMIEREALPDPTPVRARCSACEFQNYCGDIW